MIKARGARTRSEVAADLGLTRQQIWNYEHGVSEPPISVLFKIAELYGVHYNDLLNEKNFTAASNLT